MGSNDLHNSMRQAKTAGAQQERQIKCRVCTCKLDDNEEDDLALQLCSSCIGRPEAKRLGLTQRTRTAGEASEGAAFVTPVVAAADDATQGAREFTEAERVLISNVHRFMPATQLLDILNERLVCALGPDARRYTPQQLQEQIGEFAGVGAGLPTGQQGWAAMRKLLAQARRDGVLGTITEQIINDFAVVFSLNPRQVMHLKDIILKPVEDSQ